MVRSFLIIFTIGILIFLPKLFSTLICSIVPDSPKAKVNEGQLWPMAEQTLRERETCSLCLCDCSSPHPSMQERSMSLLQQVLSSTSCVIYPSNCPPHVPVLLISSCESTEGEPKLFRETPAASFSYVLDLLFFQS